MMLLHIKFLRQKYIYDVAAYNLDMLIFVDETGADIRNTVRKYGYSLRGMPLELPTMLVRGERTTAIAMMSIEGILDVHVTTGTSKWRHFLSFHRKVCTCNHLTASIHTVFLSWTIVQSTMSKRWLS